MWAPSSRSIAGRPMERRGCPGARRGAGDPAHHAWVCRGQPGQATLLDRRQRGGGDALQVDRRRPVQRPRRTHPLPAAASRADSLRVEQIEVKIMLSRRLPMRTRPAELYCLVAAITVGYPSVILAAPLLLTSPVERAEPPSNQGSSLEPREYAVTLRGPSHRHLTADKPVKCDIAPW